MANASLARQREKIADSVARLHFRRRIICGDRVSSDYLVPPNQFQPSDRFINGMLQGVWGITENFEGLVHRN